MKKLFSLIICTCLIMGLCSCNFRSSDVKNLLKAPKPSGDLYDIQKALEKSTDKDIMLKYPRAGEYRSAFVLKDINGDGTDEAFVFYSTETDDKTVVMHINMIVESEGSWLSVSDIQIQSSAIESIAFYDLDKDGILDIVSGWNKYSVVERQLCVFTMIGNKLTQRMQENYTVFTVCDINNDNNLEIITAAIDSTKKTSIAKTFMLGSEGIVERGSCLLDGNVTSYYEPVVSTLSTGQIAIYIDAVKGANGMITELIYWKNDGITNPFYDSTSNENLVTLRMSQTRATDFGGDKTLEIPYMEPLPTPQPVSETERIYTTTWRDFDGSNFENIAVTVMNYIDGYYITIPNEWVENITIVRKADQKQRIFKRWDVENLEAAEELIRVQVFSIEEWKKDADNYDDYTEITRDFNNVYVIWFGKSQHLPINKENLISGFNLFTNVKGERIN